MKCPATASSKARADHAAADSSLLQFRVGNYPAALASGCRLRRTSPEFADHVGNEPDHSS